jgi:hypothetical protein
MKNLSWLLGLVASLISIGAGLYLLSGNSAGADTTVFDLLMHGIGGYCIARGVWMLHEMAAGAGDTTVVKRLIG